MGDLPGFKELPPEQAESVLNTFARLSDGMVLRDLSHVVHLAVDAEVPAANVEQAIRSLRLGVPESPWSAPDLLHRIAHGEDKVSSRVLGQPAAVRRSLDVLLRRDRSYRPIDARVARRGDPFEITQERVHQAISHQFNDELQRPEILNRIGNNIIVFDFISEPVARQLVEKYLHAVVRRVRSRFGLRLAIAPAVADVVTESALGNLDFGGRGVSSAVETAFVNPLARALLDVPPEWTRVLAADVQPAPHGWELTLAGDI
ncbi:hypothetical protein [Arthrobacter sp. ISL-28]|uniref:hypothetical protein n=1 Tax=Arthrobacter sp. ISL-28 TaxID=2819108 RepID=UPI001BE975F6|nr:hypothetical protein [Arthrobacter sp. ISL-28]MBT2522538.1 hypothetical protein [Arthrobacter sp. ISL-28]